jgi:hypothetical protein
MNPILNDEIKKEHKKQHVSTDQTRDLGHKTRITS